MFTILVIKPEFASYANILYNHLQTAGYDVRKDSNYDSTLNSRVEAHLQDTICVIGHEEYEKRLVCVRQGNNVKQISLNEFINEYN
jgi:threonyl-tRNA synthetase